MTWKFEPTDQLDEIAGLEIYTYDVVQIKKEYKTNNWQFWCRINDFQATCIYFEVS